MEKNIKDYLHLYLGHEMICFFPNNNRLILTSSFLRQLYDDSIQINLYLLLLRPLSDLTEQESREMYYASLKIFNAKIKERGFIAWTTDDFLYLLKRGFDLFGLIEAGLAIDKTILK